MPVNESSASLLGFILLNTCLKAVSQSGVKCHGHVCGGPPVKDLFSC